MFPIMQLFCLMREKKATVKVRGEVKEVTLILPETIEEAGKLLVALPKKDLFHFIEQKMKHMARLALVHAGKPKKPKKRVVLKIDALPEDIKRRLESEGLL